MILNRCYINGITVAVLVSINMTGSFIKLLLNIGLCHPYNKTIYSPILRTSILRLQIGTIFPANQKKYKKPD
jgi:hypothetical protein